MFGGASWFAALVCVFFMPETRGKALEDIDASFRGNKVYGVDLVSVHDTSISSLEDSNGENVGDSRSTSLLI
jgi:hypothetical protein